MGSKKKNKKLKERIRSLERIVRNDAIVLSNPNDSKNMLFIGIENNEYVVKGINSFEKPENKYTPIINQKIKD